jgi:hypothetical protein
MNASASAVTVRMARPQERANLLAVYQILSGIKAGLSINSAERPLVHLLGHTFNRG